MMQSSLNTTYKKIFLTTKLYKFFIILHYFSVLIPSSGSADSSLKTRVLGVRTMKSMETVAVL